MFFCVSHQKKNLIDLPLKKNENPKHNFFFRRIRRRTRGHKRSEFSSLSLFLSCFSRFFSSRLGLFFLINSVWQILFYLLARVYISSFEKRIIRGENKLVRAIKHTHRRRAIEKKREVFSVALLLYLLLVGVEGEAKEELKREICL